MNQRSLCRLCGIYKHTWQAVLVCLGSLFARSVAQTTAWCVFNTQGLVLCFAFATTRLPSTELLKQAFFTANSAVSIMAGPKEVPFPALWQWHTRAATAVARSLPERFLKKSLLSGSQGPWRLQWEHCCVTGGTFCDLKRAMARGTSLKTRGSPFPQVVAGWALTCGWHRTCVRRPIC